MRTRTRVDVIMMVALLGVAAWMWLGRWGGDGDASPEVSPDPASPPRVQDLIRRTASGEEDGPASHTAQTFSHEESDPPPDPPVGEDPLPAIGLIRVTTPEGEVPAGRVDVFSTDGAFHAVVHNGRFGLQSAPGSMELQARVEDEYGTRLSEPAVLELLDGETTVVDFIVPHPVFSSPGFELRPGEGYAEVVRIIPGSPADLAGMMAGDAVIAIDGFSVEGLDGVALNTLLLGPPGEEVVLRLVIRNETGELEEVEARLPREVTPE